VSEREISATAVKYKNRISEQSKSTHKSEIPHLQGSSECSTFSLVFNSFVLFLELSAREEIIGYRRLLFCKLTQKQCHRDVVIVRLSVRKAEVSSPTSPRGRIIQSVLAELHLTLNSPRFPDVNENMLISRLSARSQ
jgi:hypothetical protein